jgi:hypothetical protein
VTGSRPFATGTERPIFFDETGRRARRVRAAGTVAGVVAALWLAAIVGGPLGFGRLPAGPPAALLLQPPFVLRHPHREHARVARRRHPRRSRDIDVKAAEKRSKGADTDRRTT